MKYLQLNGIQHYAFCPRQWALISIEQVWSENADTVLGGFVHKLADDRYFEEKRKDKIITRAVPVLSRELGLTGIIDVLEFHREKNGIVLKNNEGFWQPFVIEYKKGHPKANNSDIAQLVAQVMCLEEMYDIVIKKSSLYYKQTNKRLNIEITDDLKNLVRQFCTEMHTLYEQGKTPKATNGKNCQRCSLKEQCQPRLTHHKRSVSNYIAKQWDDLI